MHPFIPNGNHEREEMLKEIGVSSANELFSSIPADLQLKDGLDIEDGLSEIEVVRTLSGLAKKNTCCNGLTSFLGAGAYDGFIPAAVGQLVSRSEFYTAYTPYQPEISQGTLQAIFEFQTMICELTGMDVSNASMYDGASAAAEAAMMSVAVNNKKKVLVSMGVHPDTRRVLKSYLRFRDVEVVEIPLDGDGITDLEGLKAELTMDVGAVMIQNPNFLGHIEKGTEIGTITHTTKALFVVSVADALSLAVLKNPGEMGADIAVGEGQALGIGLSFGGPYLGFLATTSKHMRKMPGRICGETKDIDGKRAFVLTLQAREQHIRREKATSNICSNHSLCALTATIYLSLMGKEGLREAALQSAEKTRYFKTQLEKAGYKTLSGGKIFREFVLMVPEGVATLNERLEKNGFLGGYSLEKDYPELKNGMLLCVTEKRTKEEMDRFISVLSEKEAK